MQISPSTSLSLLMLLAELCLLAILTFALYGFGGKVINGVLSADSREAHYARAERWRRSWFRMVFAVGLVVGLAVVAGNLLLFLRGEVPAEVTLSLFEGISEEIRGRLLIALAKISGLVVLTAIVLRFAGRSLDALGRWAVRFDGIQANDESVEQFFASLKLLVSRAVWLAVIAVSARLLILPAPVVTTLVTALKIYLIIALGLLLWRALDAIIATVDGLSEKYAHSKELSRYYDRLKPLVPLLRRTLEYVIYLTIASLVVLQIEPVAPLAGWGSRLMRILGFFFLTRVVIEVVYLVIEELLTRGDLQPELKQRRLTLIPLARSFLQYTIYSVFLVVVLQEVGIDPMPFLAGAGIVGLAVGFGAQSLITDIFSGLFILFEGYYLVGDYIEVGDARGVVESVDLRTTRIRDDEGRHHILRNGEVGAIVNYSKEFINAVVEVGVSYDSDLDHVTRVLEEIGEQLRESRDEVIDPTRIDGVEAYAESSLILRTVTRVRPGCHRDIERDLRKRIKEAFDEHGIKIAPTISLEGIPFPMH